LARRSTQKRRPAQIMFLILSIIVVVSMAIGYLLSALPAPPPPTPTPTPTHTPQVSNVAPVHLASQLTTEPATLRGDWD